VHRASTTVPLRGEGEHDRVALLPLRRVDRLDERGLAAALLEERLERGLLAQPGQERLLDAPGAVSIRRDHAQALVGARARMLHRRAHHGLHLVGRMVALPPRPDEDVAQRPLRVAPDPREGG
jgi:hypothetical protein